MTALPQRVKHETWTLAALSAATKTMAHLLISDSCILDRYLHVSHQNLLLFIYTITYGASMACTTSSPNVYIFFIIWFIQSAARGGLGNGLNFYMLHVWRSHGGAGSWMHGLHFSFGLGNTLGLVLASPFLHDKHNNGGLTEYYGISILYPMVGSVTAAFGFNFLVAEAYSKIVQNVLIDPTDMQQKKKKTNRKVVAFVTIMCIFFLLYMGSEQILVTYLTTFSVESSLHTTKREGAFVTSIFLGAFTLGRFATIFISIHVNPLYTMVSCFALSMFGIIALLLLSQHSLLALQVSTF